MILRKSKQFSAIASKQWKTPNYFLEVLGYGENLNSERCYDIRRGIVIVWKKEKKEILDKYGKKIKTLVLEERD